LICSSLRLNLPASRVVEAVEGGVDAGAGWDWKGTGTSMLGGACCAARELMLGLFEDQPAGGYVEGRDDRLWVGLEVLIATLVRGPHPTSGVRAACCVGA